jgi:hypothetical protein
MNALPFHVEPLDGWLCGPWRQPCNNASHEAGTIHDDHTAQALGLRGGTVAGSIHMEQFVPLLVHAFGDTWQQRGSMSLWFRAPTVDREPVRAMIDRGSGPQRSPQCSLRMLTRDDLEVLEGSATAALDTMGAVRQRMVALREGAPPRLLARVPVDWHASALPTSVPQADIDRRLPLLTEGDGRSVPMSAAVHAMRVYEPLLPIDALAAVGLFGAIEWQWHAGPMHAEHDYLVDAAVLAISDSPRSEMLWVESTLRDAASGQRVATMLMLSRLLKASSPLWNETNPS